MDENILIKNAKIVDEGSIVEGDVLIRKGIIERIDPSISLPVGTRLILADNQYLLPGAIDTHVHFRDPGLTDKADFATESAAAVAGGVTSVIDMPNTLPPTLTPELLEEKFGIAAQKSSVNYSFMIGASESNLEDILRADPARVAAVKVFFGSSTGDMALKPSNVCSFPRPCSLPRIAKTMPGSPKTWPKPGKNSGKTFPRRCTPGSATRRPACEAPRQRSIWLKRPAHACTCCT